MSDIDERFPRLWPKQQPQRQDSLAEQLADLHRLAARYGMYDAADWLWKNMPDSIPPADVWDSVQGR